MNAAVDTTILEQALQNGTSHAPNDASIPPTRSRRRTLIAATIALVVAAAGTSWILLPRSSETTDNAYVAADATTVAPKVRGLVAAVLVHDNQQVRAGDPLVRIDPEEFDARAASAAA